VAGLRHASAAVAVTAATDRTEGTSGEAGTAAVGDDAASGAAGAAGAPRGAGERTNEPPESQAAPSARAPAVPMRAKGRKTRMAGLKVAEEKNKI
jgi:hypothetical protein